MRLTESQVSTGRGTMFFFSFPFILFIYFFIKTTYAAWLAYVHYISICMQILSTVHGYNNSLHQWILQLRGH